MACVGSETAWRPATADRKLLFDEVGWLVVKIMWKLSNHWLGGIVLPDVTRGEIDEKYF